MTATIGPEERLELPALGELGARSLHDAADVPALETAVKGPGKTVIGRADGTFETIFDGGR